MSAIEDLQISGGYWYLATPYSKWAEGLDDAAFTACKLRGRLMLRGVRAFSPIVHSHYVARAANIDPYSHAIWLPDDKPFFELAHGLLVADLPGWRESVGVGEEIKWARAHGKPRFLIDPASLAWAAMP